METREGREDGGYLLTAPDGAKLRVWTTDLDEDLDAPAKRGQAYRFSHLRIAQRVLLASGERVGLLDQRRRAAAADFRPGPARLPGDLLPRSRLEAQPRHPRLVPAAPGAGFARRREEDPGAGR